MKRASNFCIPFLAICLSAACGEDEDEAPKGDDLAMEEGAKLFSTVFHATFSNLLTSPLQSFQDSGIEGLSPCTGHPAAPLLQYGSVEVDFSDESLIHSLSAMLSFDGCLAIESGNEEPFLFRIENFSGDDKGDIYTWSGRLAGVTFDDTGFAPLQNSPLQPSYDNSAPARCTDVHFDNLYFEVVPINVSGESVATQSPRTDTGYSGGTLSATCGGKKLRCDIGQSNRYPSLLSLSAANNAAFESDGRTLCAFD